MEAPPPPPAAPKGAVPRSLRVGSFLLSIVLCVLFVWLLGFVLDDLGNLRGPVYDAVAGEFVEAPLRERRAELEREIAEIETSVGRQQELQQDLKRSMDNARGTMQQMMDLHRLSLERQVPPSDAEKQALATAQQRFLEAQDRYEAANAEIAASNRAKFERRQELQGVQARIAELEKPARAEFDRRQRVHRFRVASFKLAFIVPLFLLAAFGFWRWRGSAYRSILLAALAATFWKLGKVMFDHFPRDFFKYIAIAAAIGIVLAFLVWMLRKAVKPDRELLLARYREAYRSHVCPVCAHGIARGPLRYAVWTRKGPRTPAGAGAARGTAGANAAEPAPESAYTCPSCGTALFGPCASCGGVRHSLLPYCEHCGAPGETGETRETAGADPAPAG